MNTKNRLDISRAFFVIDSDHLQEVTSKLYGFVMQDDTLITNEKLLTDEMYTEGAFVYIRRNGDCITIQQDFMGSYGLYLYQDGAYFSISNSFQRLVDFLKGTRKLTLNEDYANYFVNAELCSVAFSDTLIKEIQCLDRCASISIDVPTKRLEISYCDYGENTVELSTPEGMQILDTWYRKWTGFIRNLSDSGAQIQADLSGGFDSRMTFTLLLGSGMNMDRAYIHSLNDGLHVHDEDFKIASAISEHYQFSMNNNSFLDNGNWAYSLTDTLNISFYLKLGFHKQMYYRRNCFKVPRHSFSGSGGECLRSYWKMTEEEYINKAVSRAMEQWQEDSIRKILIDSFQAIRDKYARFGRTVDPGDMTLYLYRETRCRNHFGKDIIENHFSNSVKHTPLLDPMIHKLKLSDSRCDDHNLLAAVILNRFSPELLDFPFEGGRFIDEKTKDYARELNRMYPYTPEALENSCKGQDPVIWTHAESDSVCSAEGTAIDDAVMEILNSSYIWGSFCGIYGQNMFRKLCDDIRSRKYQPLQNAYAVIGIGKAIQDCAYSRQAENADAGTWLFSALEDRNWRNVETQLWEDSYLDNYVTARLDIIADWDSTGAIQLSSVSDHNARVIVPGWLQGNCSGYVLESKKGKLSLDLKVTGGGMLRIQLKGRDVRRKDQSGIPFWIDYKKLRVSEENCFEDIKVVSHNHPFTVQRKISSGEQMHIEVEWSFHDERNACVPMENSANNPVKKVKQALKRILRNGK